MIIYQLLCKSKGVEYTTLFAKQEKAIKKAEEIAKQFTLIRLGELYWEHPNSPDSTIEIKTLFVED